MKMSVLNKDWDIIKGLATLLRDNGDKILHGESKLSLTTVSVIILNKSFTKICDIDQHTSFEVLPQHNTNVPLYHDLQFLYDFMQKTPSLKLIHGAYTIQGKVDVTPFRSLHALEIKKSPIHLIVGLQKLRQTLKEVACSRCLHNLQELFESCAGDMSSPMTWPELMSARLSYNSIHSLDGSLRLLPSLRMLDLSHNNIITVESYLQYLTELEHINLAFNSLEVMPTLAFSARAKMKSVVLRNNNLDNLDGLDELINLTDLDVGDNCISDFTNLSTLAGLFHLQRLYLEGNPLSYHNQYRVFTLHALAPCVQQQVHLDGKIAQTNEITVLSKMPPIPGQRRPPRMSSSSNMAASNGHQYEGLSRGFEDSLDSTTAKSDDAESQLATGIKPKGKRSKKLRSGRRGSLKPRKAPISDADTGIETSSPGSSLATSPVSSSSMEHKKIREEVETIRMQLGPNWLQQITAKTEITAQREITSQQDTVNTEQSATFRIGTYPETEDDIYLNENPTGQNLGRLATQSEAHDPVSNDRVDGEAEAIGSKDVLETVEDNNVVWGRGTSVQPEEFGPESEPFIVSLQEDPSTHMMLTLGVRYLWEKNLDGDVIEQLDLKSLLETNESHFEPDNRPIITMNFDYVKKDRKVRKYIMEDDSALKLFTDMLQPFLQAREASNQLKDMLQCLKCSTEFHASGASRRVKRASETVPTDLDKYERRKLLQSCLNEILVCPSCGSEHIVELDPIHLAKAQHSATNTPVGSLTQGDPLATSSKTNSPWKPKKTDTADTESVDALSYQSCNSNTNTPNTSPVKSSRSHSVDITSSRTLIQSSARSLFDTDVYHTPREDSLNDKAQLKQPRSAINNNITEDDHIDVLCNPESSDINIENRNQGSKVQFKNSDTLSDHTDSGQRSQNHRRRLDSGGSDITVISNPSQSSIAVINSSHELPVEQRLNNPMSSSKSVTDELNVSAGTVMVPQIGKCVSSDHLTSVSPSGSLSSTTCTSMVASMYENTSMIASSNDNTNDTQDSSQSKEQEPTEENQKHKPLDTLSDTSFKSIESSVEGVDIDVVQLSDDATEVLSGLPGEGEGDLDIDPRPESDQGVGTVELVKQASGDFSQVDHRLKLYLMMSLFNDEEDCELVLKTSFVAFSNGQEKKGLVVVSSENIYFLHIARPECEEQPEKWLKCLEKQPLTEVHYVDVGLQHQSLRLEFGSEAESYKLLLRDEAKCRKFLRQLTGIIQGIAFHSESKLEGIGKSNLDTLHHILEEVLHAGHGGTDEVTEDTSKIKLFVLAFLKTGELDSKGSAITLFDFYVTTTSGDMLLWSPTFLWMVFGGNEQLSSVSIVVTSQDIILTQEDHHWPLPRHRKQVLPPGAHFKVLDNQKINEVSNIDIYEDDTTQLSIVFFNEENDEECSWHIVMETASSLDTLLTSICKPWEAEFGVELQVNKQESVQGQEL
ncbi:unnamed protein product [Owenia fusiformis]|uniref:Serine/threonine-protein kinase 11-interacting protein n=1 Tax=Owenia fusiformis TaxID=6347 RepID=A0A8S4N2H7_OWEFU|nr:unnamed protein product [Owenia fusiformis]